MSTYLIAFVVSNFDHKDGGKEILHRVFAAPNEMNKTSYALAEGEVILNLISNYVQVPYTWPKMDQAAIPTFRLGGKFSQMKRIY